MSIRKVGFVEWPEGLDAAGSQWGVIADTVDSAQLDLLVTNEMPFGSWLAEKETFDISLAKTSVSCHERGLEALLKLKVGAVISSSPKFSKGVLVNEAFVLENGKFRAIHQKHYFPQEEGYFEASWFHTEMLGFDAIRVAGIKVGTLLCTELFFNEHARAYGKQGADLIVVPRATGKLAPHWQTAASMAAIVSGAYVISSNRIGRSMGGTEFGGNVLLYTPQGESSNALAAGCGLYITEIDLDISKRQKAIYPCYVIEKSMG